ncbi:hypothetical protein Acy02nite_11900 [Actinoplanes cyaneus]|uniref:Uncharacterized protein n=1 Tax=Actinoplanes cyaneus TaxID=52696 RepID=A0A919ICM0_9ACTN|nr:hypothetical protein Acy02nite_11900 [Actinoplanes cyaneus]
MHRAGPGQSRAEQVEAAFQQHRNVRAARLPHVDPHLTHPFAYHSVVTCEAVRPASGVVRSGARPYRQIPIRSVPRR